MEKSYKVIEIERESNRLRKKKYKATIASIFSTFALGISIISVVAFSCFEPLNTIQKDERELFIMTFSVIGAINLYCLINSICKKVNLESRIDELAFQKRMENVERSIALRKKK